MDSAYLQKVLGRSLVDCLTEVCLKRPTDPTEYIAYWLKNNSKNLKNMKREAMEEEELRKQREEYRVWKEKECQRRREIERALREEAERTKFLEEERRRLMMEMEEAAADEEGENQDDHLTNNYLSNTSTTISEQTEPSGSKESVKSEGDQSNESHDSLTNSMRAHLA